MEAVASITKPASRLWRWLVVALIGLFIALLAYGLSVRSPSGAVDSRLRAGHSAAAPDFSLEPLTQGALPAGLSERFRRIAADGKVGLVELKGVPIMLNLWASWCTPCREEAHRLEQGWRRFGRYGVLFLGIDMQDLRDDAHSFLSKYGLDYPSLRDPGKSVATSYGATGIPETYFIDTHGRVVGHVIGVVSRQALTAGIAAVQSGRVIGVVSGGHRFSTRR